MTGSTPFLIEESENFKRSFKKLAKAYGDDFVEFVAEVLEGLIEDQYPINSRQEPLPRKINLPQGWTFHKLEFTFSKAFAAMAERHDDVLLDDGSMTLWDQAEWEW